MPGQRRGHEKHGHGEGNPPTDPPPQATAIETTSTMAFALTPPALTVDGNTCSVAGLDPGLDVDASTEFKPDDGSGGFISGYDANENPDAPGEYSWKYNLTGSEPGSGRTWLRAKGSAPYPVTPLTGPDGQPLEWSFRFEG